MQSKNPTLSTGSRKVSLFRNGANQAVRIPREFELPASEALIHREDDRLIIEALPARPSLLETLRKLEPLDETFPDVDASLPPAEPIDLK
ncbi:MAG: antitoxin [Opitutales bacterium]